MTIGTLSRALPSLTALLLVAGCGGEAEGGAEGASSAGAAAAVVSALATREVSDDTDWAVRTEGDIQSVPFPIYPGAILAAWGVVNDTGDMGMTLQSADPAEEVAAFYRERMADARSRVELGTHYFWLGAETYDPVRDEGVANVQVRKSFSSDTTFVYMFIPSE